MAKMKKTDVQNGGRDTDKLKLLYTSVGKVKKVKGHFWKESGSFIDLH